MLSRTVCVVDEAHLVILWTQTVPIGEDDKAFFVRLGARMAEPRKSPQVEMAKTLGVSQQDHQLLRGRSQPHPGLSALDPGAHARSVLGRATRGRVRCG